MAQVSNHGDRAAECYVALMSVEMSGTMSIINGILTTIQHYADCKKAYTMRVFYTQGNSYSPCVRSAPSLMAPSDHATLLGYVTSVISITGLKLYETVP